MGQDTVPSFNEIRRLCFEKFHIRPCLWQINVVRSILGGKNTISIAATGMGKTLTFWLPLLFRPPGCVQIIVTPLNVLGKQNVNSLKKAGLRGIFICAETATLENFRAIETLQYQAVVINPEQAVKYGGLFDILSKNPLFLRHLISTIYDEAHCISGWRGFRPDYGLVGRLNELYLKDIPIMLASATLPEVVLADVLRVLGLGKKDFTMIRKSCDRPNVDLYVRPIINSLSSFADLEFLLCNWKVGDPPPPKFIVFFDNIADSVKACLHLRSLLPIEYRSKINWFNSEMSNTFKDDEVKSFTSGDTWGELASESLGMGMDIPDIRVIVQWRVTCTLTTMWQRFGRAGRNQGLRAAAILLAEKEYFDEEKERKEASKRKRELKKQQANKRPRVEAQPVSVPPTRAVQSMGDAADTSDSEAGSEQETPVAQTHSTGEEAARHQL